MRVLGSDLLGDGSAGGGGGRRGSRRLLYSENSSDRAPEEAFCVSGLR